MADRLSCPPNVGLERQSVRRSPGPPCEARRVPKLFSRFARRGRSAFWRRPRLPHGQPGRLQRMGLLGAYALDALGQIVERLEASAARTLVDDDLRGLGPDA